MPSPSAPRYRGPTRWTRLFYVVLWWLSTLLYLLNRPCVRGRPPSGPRIYAANHVSYADVYLVSRALVRGFEPLWFLAKKELREAPIVGAITRNSYTIFIDRDQPEKAAIEATVRAAREAPVVIFPEGTRSRTLELQEGKAGLGLIARLARVPVVPVAITGTERPLWQLALGRLHPAWRVRIVIGEPWLPPRGARPHEITDTIMRRIAAALPPDRRGAYALPAQRDAPDPASNRNDQEKPPHATAHLPGA